MTDSSLNISYDEKQALKKARYAEKAKELRAEIDAISEQNCSDLSCLPGGQPILVGHHSEKNHRRLLERVDNRMRKSFEIEEKAEYYEHRANAVSNAISSEDENAITKLKEKIAQKEKRQLEMKQANKEYRKGGIDAITSISDKEREEIRDFMARYPSYTKPFKTFQLTNNNASIKRLKERLLQLKEEAARPEQEPIKGNGFIITENKEDTRLWVEFDHKPEKDICQIMRSRGFKWSPTRNAWVRLLNNSARYAAQRLYIEINELKKSS